jgi:peptidoglycan-N-acetylglucosamine deacetylase
VLAGGALGVGGALVGAGGEWAVERELPRHGRSARPGGAVTGAVGTQVMWHGDAEGGRLYLTFDDGPDPRWTPRVLDMLAAHGATATFFMVGRRAERHPDLVRRVVAAGHAIGSHTYRHTDLSAATPDQVRDELARAHEAIAQAAGRPPAMVRPPWGRVDPVGMLAAARHAYPVVLWSAQITAGHVDRDYRRTVADLRPGAIVLLHDGGPTPTDALMRATGRLLDHARGRYALAPVTDLLPPAGH